jgi:DNA-binding transcriptional MerR regulator
MTKIRRVETYFSPKGAERFTGLSRNALIRYVRRGVLTHFRTAGGHRRYALSELKALREALERRAARQAGSADQQRR